MAMGTADVASVNLVHDQLNMSQALNMPIFRLVKWNFQNFQKTPSDVPTKKGIRMVFVMKRKITSELMTTYFPTILLTAITFATTFFKPLFFEAALSVNLTTMLVMTTIFISKLESLPPTSDIKMIDIWLILCQIYPFAEVVLLTAMEYKREEKKKGKKTKRKGKKKAKIIQTTTLTVTPLNGIEVFGETKMEGFFSKFTMPSLKTLGEFIHTSYLSFFYTGKIFGE